jgi:hypothetical protein
MVEEVRSSDPLFFENDPGRTATHVMIGATFDGLILRVAILEVRPGVWRPITAWESRDARGIWEQYRGKETGYDQSR